MRSVWGTCGCEANDSACFGTVGTDIAVWAYTRKELEAGVIQHSYFRLGGILDAADHASVTRQDLR